MFCFFQTYVLFFQNVKILASTSTGLPNYITSRILILPYSFSFPHFKTKSMSNFIPMFSVTIFTVSIRMSILLWLLPQNLDHPWRVSGSTLKILKNEQGHQNRRNGHKLVLFIVRIKNPSILLKNCSFHPENVTEKY